MFSEGPIQSSVSKDIRPHESVLYPLGIVIRPIDVLDDYISNSSNNNSRSSSPMRSQSKRTVKSSSSSRNLLSPLKSDMNNNRPSTTGNMNKSSTNQTRFFITTDTIDNDHDNDNNNDDNSNIYEQDSFDSLNHIKTNKNQLKTIELLASPYSPNHSNYSKCPMCRVKFRLPGKFCISSDLMY